MVEPIFKVLLEGFQHSCDLMSVDSDLMYADFNLMSDRKVSPDLKLGIRNVMKMTILRSLFLRFLKSLYLRSQKELEPQISLE